MINWSEGLWSNITKNPFSIFLEKFVWVRSNNKKIPFLFFQRNSGLYDFVFVFYISTRKVVLFSFETANVVRVAEGGCDQPTSERVRLIDYPECNKKLTYKRLREFINCECARKDAHTADRASEKI